jgi:phage terminase small subunit
VASKKAKPGSSKEEVAKRKALFVEAYVSHGGNATAAAITAGYSKKTAASQGQRLLKHVEISSQVDARRAETIKKAEESTELTVAGVLRELHSMVHADLRGAFDEKGALLPPSQWPDGLAKAIASVKVVELAGGAQVNGEAGVMHVPMFTKEVKLWDKNSAIDKAMKHLGLFEKDNSQQPVTAPVFNIIAR